MGCSNCGTGGGCSTGGCKNSGLCASGSCNKMNAYDWISTLDYEDPSAYEFVEVSFKNGARKEFFKNPNHLTTGDTVLVEVNGGGYDIGKITLSGDLVRLQMKKKYTNEDRISLAVIRKANERDLEKLENKLQLENDSMVLSRAIARSLGLEIKIGDVEYQGDMKKATFFFTANGRVDFRELVRAYAKEFKVKIEMRQIGSRQESARIGGIGSCGRELCCSTWLSDFRSVNTTVARYQNIAINQTKLSGQCGRLKCCLNYELDSYVDALQHFPTHANTLMTKKGKASLVKTDIFKGLMFYVYEDITMRGVFHQLDKEKVKEILEMNKKGIHPEDLTTFADAKDDKREIGFADVTGEIELPNKKKKKNKKKGKPVSDNVQPNSDGPKTDQAQGNKPQPNKGQPNPNQQKQNPRNQESRPDNRGQNRNQQNTGIPDEVKNALGLERNENQNTPKNQSNPKQGQSGPNQKNQNKQGQNERPNNQSQGPKNNPQEEKNRSNNQRDESKPQSNEPRPNQAIINNDITPSTKINPTTQDNNNNNEGRNNKNKKEKYVSKHLQNKTENNISQPPIADQSPPMPGDMDDPQGTANAGEKKKFFKKRFFNKNKKKD